MHSTPGDSPSHANATLAPCPHERPPALLRPFDPDWDVTMTMPDGGLFSTTRDIARFAESFLDGRNIVLSDESIEEMLTAQSDRYGLDWILDAEGQFSHWGSSGTRVWGDRRTGGVGVVFFQIQD